MKIVETNPEGSPLPAEGAKPGRNTWPIVFGVVFIVCWVAAAVVLFYAIAVSGIVADGFFVFLKTFLFPGTANNPPELLTWVPSMQLALILAGAAGIAAGLAIFWRSRRNPLLLGFALSLLAGILCGLYSIYTFFTAFTR